MYSNNNKISTRQIFRLLTYDILGVGTLLLPSLLAGKTAKNGMAALLLGIIGGILFFCLMGVVIRYLDQEESYQKFLKRCFGNVSGTVILICYVLYYLCLGGYTAYIFGDLMITDLLKEESFYWIVAGILGLCVYAIAQGIEGRARVYEILFWFLMIPLFIMLVLAARDIEVFRLFPLYPVNKREVHHWLLSGYDSFGIFSLGGLALFLVPFAAEQKAIKKAGIKAVLFSGGVLLVLYVILQGIFGVKETAALKYPAVTLMSMIQIPGGFFERQDALMVAIWFFTVFALLGSSLFYVTETVKDLLHHKSDTIVTGAAALCFWGIGVGCYRFAEFSRLLQKVFICVGTPFIVTVPLLAICCMQWKKGGKRLMSILLISCSAFLFSGCSTMELENRNFPLAMGVDKREDDCLITYKFQNLSAIADENAKASGSTDFYIKENDFFTGISKYANDTNKILDYNHLKVLVLSKEFISDVDAFKEFLAVCGKEELLARNTILFFADDAAEILALDENLDTAVGSYLEEMIESREDYKLKDTVTLGDLYNDRANKEQLLLIPVLSEKGGLPVISSYYAISGGELKGEVTINEAMLSYLVQGKLKKLSFTLDDHTAILVKKISTQGSFSRGEDTVYHSKITLEAAAEQGELSESEEIQLENRIRRLFVAQLVENSRKLLEEQGIDMTNSFYKLGMYDREKYQRYKTLPQYIKKMGYTFEVRVILLNGHRTV